VGEAAGASGAKVVACYDPDMTVSGVSDRDSASETRTLVSIAHGDLATRPIDGSPPSPLPAPRAAIASGTTLGRHVILRELGKGAMGAVFAAYDPQLDRKVALKRLLVGRPSASATENGEAVARLHREARSLAKLSHPNVVQIYEVGEHDGIPHIVMELVDGTTLRKWARERERPWQERLAALLEAGRGLAAAHDAGLLHRDFKPDNVLVGNDGRVCVADFGLAKRPAAWIEPHDPEVAGIPAFESSPVSSLGSPLTEQGTVLGTLPYVAPEQYYVRVPVGTGVDQYAFCVSAWELLCGARPFRGTAKAMLESKRQGPPAWPSDSEVPRHIGEAVRRGLAVEPDERWPSMHALLEAMQPRPPQRWWAWSLAAALVLAGVGVAASSSSSVEPPCTGARAHVDAIWGPEARASVEQALLGTGLAYAPATWDVVSARLDDFGERWSTMHTEACEATAVHGEQSSKVLDLRMECLEHRLHAMRATVEALGEVDAEAAERAIDAVEGLPELERCADVATLRALVPPPEDPTIAAELEALQPELARAAVQRRMGRFDAALATLEALDDRARPLGHEPFTARVAYELGMTLTSVGRGRPAMGQLETAYVAALEHGDDDLAARAASELAGLMVDVVSEPELGMAWATSALALVRRRHRGKPLEAVVLTDAGHVLAEAGEATRAVVWLRQAVELLERKPWATDTELSVPLNMLGIVLHDQGRMEEALAVLQRARTIDERTYGPKHPRTIAALSNLGGVLMEVGRYADSIALLEQALAATEETWPTGHPEHVALLSNLGIAHVQAGDPEAALRALQRAMVISEEVHGAAHITTTNTMMNTAGVLHDLKRNEEGIALLRRAIALGEAAAGPRHERIASYHISLGTLLLEADRIDEARVTFERALEIQQARLEPSDPELAQSRSVLGILHRKLGELPQSEALLRQALASFHETLGDEHLLARRTRYELGLTLEARGRIDEARVEIAKVATQPVEHVTPEIEDAKEWLAEHPERLVKG